MGGKEDYVDQDSQQTQQTALDVAKAVNGRFMQKKSVFSTG
jgi:hypothetical protein